MKTLYFAAMAACMTILLSCEKLETLNISQEKKFYTPFRSSVREQILLQDSSASLVVEIKNISDLRCPSHQDCAEPGQASVRLLLDDRGKAKAETFLHLSNHEGEHTIPDSITISLDDKSYIVKLHSVNPHPAAQKQEEQTAELSVKPAP